jgi:hypothetical protein
MNNKRNYARVPFIKQAQVQCGDTKSAGCLIDISLKGALLQFPPDAIPSLTCDNQCEIIIVLAGSDIQLRFQAKATHFNDHTIGFNFTSMDGDSIIHLRRLLELNTGNPEEIDRELSYMINH